MSNTVSNTVLEEIPARVLLFLRAVATKIEIRTTLVTAGYTEEEQSYGWKLLLEASGYAPSALPVSGDDKARAAIAELDDWDESGFRRIHAALGRLHPEQDAFVFAGLEPGKGPSAVVSVATLLDRVDALESSPERAATAKADKKAIATLAQRGIDAAERARLRELVEIAKGISSADVSAASESDERQRALAELYAWYKDWSETARALIRRRDHLVLMGLAKRKRSTTEEPEVSPVATSPALTAPSPALGNGSGAAPHAGPNNGGTTAPTPVV